MALRPEVGTQPQFRKKKPPATYRYDSSLSPSLEWDGKNSVRELGEWLLACIEDAAKLPPHEFAEPSLFRDEAGPRVAECRGLRMQQPDWCDLDSKSAGILASVSSPNSASIRPADA